MENGDLIKVAVFGMKIERNKKSDLEGSLEFLNETIYFQVSREEINRLK